MIVTSVLSENRNGRTNNGEVKPRQSVKRADLSPALILLLGESPASIAAKLRLEKLSTVSSLDEKVEEVKYRFNPLISPYEDKSIVTLKGKVNRESRTFEIPYDPASIPNSTEIQRDQIKLPGIPEEKVLKAKAISALICKSSKKITDSTRIKDLNVYRKVFEEKAGRLSADKNDVELFTLSAFFCLEQNGGFLSKLPDGLLSENESSLPERIRVLGRYFIVNHHKADTAKKAEQFELWRTKLPEAGLTRLYDFFSPSDLLKICFPGYLETRMGKDFKYIPPVIREYLLPGCKWEGNNNLLTLACQDIFFSQGVVGEHGIVDKKAILSKDWSQIYRDKENGINGALGDSVYLHGALDALNKAAPGLFGIDEKLGQILPWKLEYIFIIDKTEEGEKKLDQITRFIVEKKLKLFNEAGEVCTRKLREVRNWTEEYNKQKIMCLSSAGIKNTEEALKRVYPDLFGWEGDKIQPGEIKYPDKWKGKEGKKLFALRFAKSLHTVFEHLKNMGVEGFENHGVIFTPKEKPPLYLPKSDFNKLKNYYIENKITWWDHYLWFNLTGGFFTVAGNLEKSFTLLFGKENRKTGCLGDSEISVEDIRERSPFKASTATELLCEVPIEYSYQDLMIKGIKKEEYSKTYTGIQGTCIESILAHEKKADALYTASFAATISIKDDEISILEKIITAKDFNNNNFILCDSDLRILLNTLKDDIVPNLRGNQEIKNTLTEALEKILNAHLPLNSPRDLLAYTTETERKFKCGNNSLGLLDEVIERIIDIINMHEFQSYKFNGNYSSQYQRIASTLNAKGVAS